MAVDPPSDRAPKFIVRLPDGMRDRIAEAARANNRSMNAEIVARLEATFARPSGERLLTMEQADIIVTSVLAQLANAPAKVREKVLAEAKESRAKRVGSLTDNPPDEA